jgi:hypothetical protein
LNGPSSTGFEVAAPGLDRPEEQGMAKSDVERAEAAGRALAAEAYLPFQSERK